MSEFSRWLSLRKRARTDAKQRRDLAGLSRTVQVSRSTVSVGGVDLELDGVLSGAVGTGEAARELESDVSYLDDGMDADTVLGSGAAADAGDLAEIVGAIPDLGDAFDQAADADDEAHEGRMGALEAAIAVDEAQATADGAAAEALLAKTTADGKNRIFAQEIRPVAHPEIPFTAGDLWYETDAEGRFVNVHVWNVTASDFVQYRLVASSLLVPGSVGNILLEDGAITGPKIAATAIDGKTITGALIRTAASGQRLQLDVDGLRTFDVSGAVTARLAANTGWLGLSGDLVVDGAIRTSSSMERTQFDSEGIRVFNSAGENRATIGFLGGYMDFSGHMLFRNEVRFNDGTYVTTASLDRPNILVKNGRIFAETPPMGGPGLVVESSRGITLTAGAYGVLLDSPAVALRDDTSWANISVTGATAGFVRWRRYLGRTYLRFDFTLGTSSAIGNGSSANVFIVPSAAGLPEFVTPVSVTGVGIFGYAGQINPGGTVTIANSSGAGRTRFYGSADWEAV